MNTRDVVIGATMGSALMFMLNPDRGRRRRALVRDKAWSMVRKTRGGLDATSREMPNRVAGVAAVARRWATGFGDDGRLSGRVRAALGGVCSHPGAIKVEARDGHVTLRGPVLASEAGTIIAAIAAVPGVIDVVDQLKPYDRGDRVQAWQGSGRTAGASFDRLQRNWAPAQRTVITAGLMAAGVWMAVAARRSARRGEHDGGYVDAAM